MLSRDQYVSADYSNCSKQEEKSANEIVGLAASAANQSILQKSRITKFQPFDSVSVFLRNLFVTLYYMYNNINRIIDPEGLNSRKEILY